MDINWSNSNALVMGLGAFGGGEAVTRFLLSQGANVVVTDLKNEDELANALARLEKVVHHDRLTLRLGGHDIADAEHADVLIVNPAIPSPWSNALLNAARATSTRILTEIRIAIGSHPARHVIGITGTQGKSTTSAMVAHILQRTHPELSPRLGGNIGGSLLDDPPPADATLVLELSSFMLHWLATDASAEADRFTPGVAAITNLSANHLDWHTTFEHYASSKKAIFTPTVACSNPRRVGELEPTLHNAVDNALTLLIPGEHNRTNAALAVAIVLEHLVIRGIIETPTPDVAARCAATLNDFPGLPHRLFRLGIFGGVECIDDSKATTPEATMRAVSAFPETARVHLIAGGYDKGSDLSSIARLGGHLAGLYTIGATGSTLASDVGHACVTLENAVACAAEHATPGDVLLLSPGCASWDQFQNYEARGLAFAKAIKRSFVPSTH